MQSSAADSVNESGLSSRVLHRSVLEQPPSVSFAEGNYIHLTTGQKILDATGGAAVACLGHGNKRIAEAIGRQAGRVAYCHTLFFACQPVEELAEFMIDTTYGDMSRAYFVSSGSEAIEAALKFARQFHLEKNPREPDRVHFISRRQSYHGSTLGALAAGGHKQRRAAFEPILSQNTSWVSPCFPYRPPRPDLDTDSKLLRFLEAELEAEFQRVGAGRVAAFIAEPVVGAALGCVSAIPGYFAAVRRVCDRHGALLIMDDIMSGSGRVGPEPSSRYPSPLHSYQDPDIGGGVIPDILTLGKGLGGGYQPIAAMLINKRVTDVLAQGSGTFMHGQTYQGHPVACQAALTTQQIIKQQGLIDNVRTQGKQLGVRLKQELMGHANVGEIRGKGLFWAIEFVADKDTKAPFRVELAIALKIHQLGR